MGLNLTHSCTKPGMHVFVGYHQVFVRANCSRSVGTKLFIFVGLDQVGFDGFHAKPAGGA